MASWAVISLALAAVNAPTSRVRGGAVAALVVVLVARRQTLQWRWQLIPAVTAAAVSAIADAPSVVLSGLAVLSAALTYVLPPPTLPAPTGPFRVCRRVFAGTPHGTHCSAQIWFPIDPQAPKSLPRAPYFVNGFETVRGLAKFGHVPSLAFYHVQGTAHAVLDGASADLGVAGSRGLPVLIFSHGLGAVPELYTTLLQNVASQGVVVIAPTHTGGNACFSAHVDPTTGVRHAVPYQPLTADEAAQSGLEIARRSREAIVRAQECSALLDLAMEGNAGRGPWAPLLWGTLDPARVGVFGHSFGGATAILAAHTDARFTAVCAHDAWMLPIPAKIVEEGLQQPALFMQGDHFQKWRVNNDVKLKLVHSGLDSSLFSMRATRHQNFTDIPWFGPALFRKMKLIGTVDVDAAMRVIINTTVEFFAVQFAAPHLATDLAPHDAAHMEWDKPPAARL